MTEYVPLALPVFVQEMVLAVWQTSKGFSAGVDRFPRADQAGLVGAQA